MVDDLDLALRAEHAEEIPHHHELLNDFLSVLGLHNLDRRLISEFCIDHVVQRVEVYSFVALLDSSDVVNVPQTGCPVSLRDAEDACFLHFHEVLRLVNHHALNLACVQEHEAEGEYSDRHSILPPMPDEEFKVQINARNTYPSR